MTRAADPGDRRARPSADSGHSGADPGSSAQFRSVPILETERLVLREFRIDDLDALVSTMRDPAVVRHLAIDPQGREDVWRRLLLAAGQWPLLGLGYWAVTTRLGGPVIGQIGFCDFQRDMAPDISGLPEMGWIFDSSVHGQGYAHEAGTAALAWADANLGPVEIPAIISLDNAPSMKLAERLGFVRDADGQYHEEAIALFRRPPQDRRGS